MTASYWHSDSLHHVSEHLSNKYLSNYLVFFDFNLGEAVFQLIWIYLGQIMNKAIV